MSTKKVGSFIPDEPGWHQIIITKEEGADAPIEMFIGGIPEETWKHRPYERTDTPEAEARLKQLLEHDDTLKEINEPGPDKLCFICRRPALVLHKNIGVCSVSCLNAEG